jgi:hypothetical protein
MTNLIAAMTEVNDLNRSHGIVQRGGKKYTEVFVRVEAFRKHIGMTHGINTEIAVDDGTRVVVKATVIDDKGMIIGSGFAEEIRGSSNVNKTSALENCETSAIGRALASLGLHGGAYASVNELDGANRKAEALAQAPAPAAAPKADPRQGAVDWCKKSVDNIKACTSLPQLQAWDDKNDLAIDKLKLNHPDLFDRLFAIYNEQEGTLNGTT